MFLRKSLLAAAVTMFHFTAQASLLAPLEYRDGTHTWLQLSETGGISIEQFRAGAGGWNATYRLATSDEIAGLLSSFHIPEGDSGFNVGAFGPASDFFYSIGGTAPGGAYSGTWGRNGDQGAIGVGLGWYVSATRIEEGPAGPNCPQYFTCTRTIALRGEFGSGAWDTGLFLIRDDAPQELPEPAGVALMGLAGGLLAFQRRRQNR